MEIILVSPDKLKIRLTRIDMEDLSLKYEDLDYANLQTKEAILSLLEQAKLSAGFNPQNAKLFIEVYPTQEGGCVLYFTAHSNTLFDGPRKGYRIEPSVFEFESADALIEGSVRLFERYSHRIYKSSLYRLGEKYRLILHPLDYSDRLSVYFLCEYARKVGEGEILAAFTQEHGLEIAKDNALDLLAEHFLDS